jgi:hypothetical protein
MAVRFWCWETIGEHLSLTTLWASTACYRDSVTFSMLYKWRKLNYAVYSDQWTVTAHREMVLCIRTVLVFFKWGDETVKKYDIVQENCGRVVGSKGRAYYQFTETRNEAICWKWRPQSGCYDDLYLLGHSAAQTGESRRIQPQKRERERERERSTRNSNLYSSCQRYIQALAWKWTSQPSRPTPAMPADRLPHHTGYWVTLSVAAPKCPYTNVMSAHAGSHAIVADLKKANQRRTSVNRASPEACSTRQHRLHVEPTKTTAAV